MDVVELSRLQFGATTVYHFMFVPLTIGLSPLVAVLQTIWLRTGDVKWYKLTRFFGKLLLINFAIGVATGIVQEFQFGMNWSEYSRYVGDVFGAPLAMEALGAFFIESIFLGLWIFGWDRLPRWLHLACIWMVSLATWMSAYFILAANSFMQHPVGAQVNPETGRAELTSILELVTNSTTLVAFPHVIAGALLTGATFVCGVCCWWMVRAARKGDEQTAQVYRSGVMVGVVALFISGIGIALTGDAQAKIMFEQQPQKMAAAEGLCHTEQSVPFSILTIGDLSDPNNCSNVTHLLQIPGGTSFLASGSFDHELLGVTELQAYYEESFPEYAAQGVNFIPNLAITYWTFRLMIGPAAFCGLLALAALWLTRKKRTSTNVWLGRLGIISIPMPFLANSFGWIFTEMGRQPWIVHPAPGTTSLQLLVRDGVSNHGEWIVWTSLIGFTLLYGVLAVFWVRLMTRYVKEGLPTEPVPVPLSEQDETQLHFAY